MSRNALSTLPGLAPRRHARPASVAWAWLLAAMVLAQSLGVLHNVVHAVPAHRDGPVCALRTEVPEHVTTGWVADLFAAHGDESDCRLYDQFSHGDCVLAMPLLCLPA